MSGGSLKAWTAVLQPSPLQEGTPERVRNLGHDGDEAVAPPGQNSSQPPLVQGPCTSPAMVDPTPAQHQLCWRRMVQLARERDLDLDFRVDEQRACVLEVWAAVLRPAPFSSDSQPPRNRPWTTVVLVWRRMFQLARERDLDLDFHVDENGNARAQGLLHVARKTVQHGWQGRAVCGHCW